MTLGMASSSPTAEGFRLIFRQPTIPLAELAWRWSFAGAAWFLIAAFLLEYGDSLGVTTLDCLLLGTQQPALVWDSIRHIFQGSAFRFTQGGIVLAIALTIAWIVLASLGRLVVLRAMAREYEPSTNESWRTPLRSLAGLNFLRAAAALAGGIGKIGAFLLASSLWASTHMKGGDAARLSMALLVIVITCWAVLNWLLSTAAVFVVAEQDDAIGAIGSTVRLCWKQMGPVIVVGVLFGLIHIGAFLTMWGAGLTVLSLGSVLGAGPTLFLALVILIAYFGVTDFLYTARLAAYLAIIKKDEVPEVVSPEPSGPVQPSAVDPTELILSDVPLPAS
jgi:hypothetical protein